MVWHTAVNRTTLVQFQVLPLLSHQGKFIQKEVKIIILITQKECIELQKLGHKFGNDGTLHHTYTKHKTYYLTESKKAMNDLMQIRKSKIIK